LREGHSASAWQRQASNYTEQGEPGKDAYHRNKPVAESLG